MWVSWLSKTCSMGLPRVGNTWLTKCLRKPTNNGSQEHPLLFAPLIPICGALISMCCLKWIRGEISIAGILLLTALIHASIITLSYLPPEVTEPTGFVPLVPNTFGGRNRLNYPFNLGCRCRFAWNSCLSMTAVSCWKGFNIFLVKTCGSSKTRSLIFTG